MHYGHVGRECRRLERATECPAGIGRRAATVLVPGRDALLANTGPSGREHEHYDGYVVTIDSRAPVITIEDVVSRPWAAAGRALRLHRCSRSLALP